MSDACGGEVSIEGLRAKRKEMVLLMGIASYDIVLPKFVHEKATKFGKGYVALSFSKRNRIYVELISTIFR